MGTALPVDGADRRCIAAKCFAGGTNRRVDRNGCWPQGAWCSGCHLIPDWRTLAADGCGCGGPGLAASPTRRHESHSVGTNGGGAQKEICAAASPNAGDAASGCAGKQRAARGPGGVELGGEAAVGKPVARARRRGRRRQAGGAERVEQRGAGRWRAPRSRRPGRGGQHRGDARPREGAHAQGANPSGSHILKRGKAPAPHPWSRDGAHSRGP